MSEPKRLALVAIGGMVGALTRYGISVGFESEWPWATLLINILGALAIGVIAGTLTRGGPPILWPLLITGLLGGFTTVSAFALETFAFFETGSLVLGFGYFTLTMAGGLTAVAIGHRLAGDRL